MSKDDHHPWHSVSPGDNLPEIVNAIIEIPKGSKAKYEIDKDSNLIKLDRVLFSSVMYPANYGFIPQTYCDDNDPLDILVLCSVDVYPMTISRNLTLHQDHFIALKILYFKFAGNERKLLVCKGYLVL